MPRIVVTPGEPAGIGPDLVIRMAQQPWSAELIVIADPELLQQRAKQINLPLRLIEANLTQQSPHQPGTLKIIPVALTTTCRCGELNKANASYVLRTLELAATLCLQYPGTALVTGPVHKGVMNQAGIHFSGHTEFFAQVCNVSRTLMLFVAPQMKVALATTHLPLAKVSAAITVESLQEILLLLESELQKKFHLATPKILVCGLNPHAGEGGYLGREEIEIIEPTLNRLRNQGLTLIGPLPADTAFTPTHLENCDVVLAMYHDQGLPVVKYANFQHAVNVTLGLPFIRTSVDHGTALDLAGSDQVDSGSMFAALTLAIQLQG